MLKLSLPSAYGVATYPPGATFGPRLLQDHEFVWVLEGHAQYLSGSKLLELPPGTLLLCQAGSTDFFAWDPDHHTRHAYVHFQIEEVPASWLPAEGWPRMCAIDSSSILVPLFEHLLACVETASEEQIKAVLELMLTAFVTGQTTLRRSYQKWPRTLEQVMKQVHDTLEQNPAHPFTLKELARIANITPEYLCRLFKTHTGHPPLEWVRLVRLDRALVLVTRTNYRFSEISHLLGFASPFHFSRRFKSAYGFSPREVREQARSGKSIPLSRLVQVEF
ncbi:AraC family transcriptional regulator [Deinococcus roseus]|uniref:HTH araC/xylS-type domain-containing protein n=1 Tax=Deinococcus roseus TaxID=392414 RepID=A0ABQ2CW91_9DEIO|nr:AraC family transcriptional regulator [Deinococcus roseus]GGJ27115.1 hypothetical protein GCM10008938_11570 [Deinococcus roseus]